MSLHRAIGGSGPLEPEPVGSASGPQVLRRATRSTLVAVGTLACPSCDAPVLPPAGRTSPADPVRCAFCSHEDAIREFLRIGEPTRPTRVAVHVRDHSR